MSASDLARALSSAAWAHRASESSESLQQLEALCREAVAHVRRSGYGTVDHIVLNSTLKLIATSTPAIKKLLEDDGWRWL